MPPPPMSAEELELKQHVTQTLASQGVLGKIKAQLRAAVFHVMHEHEPGEELTDSTLWLREFGRDGEQALELVLEFLEFFRLEHSLTVLAAEASVDEKERELADTRTRLGALGLNFPDGDDGQQPLLIQLLRLTQSCVVDKGALHVRGDDRDTQAKVTRFSLGESNDRDMRLEEEEERAGELPQSTTLSSERLALSTASRFGEADGEERDPHRDAKQKANRVDEDEDDVAVGSESIASGSELDESIAEQSASLNYSQDYESPSRDDASDLDDRTADTSSAQDAKEQGFQTRTTATTRQKQRDESDADEDEDADEDDTRAVDAPTQKTTESAAMDPPPVPTKLSSLPPLGSLSSKQAHQDDDEFDEELEAERLSSLDAKLKAMEAEDETGTLQQLKATLQMELQQDDESVRSKSDGGAVAGGGATDDDGYGSDFEEEEVISKVSDEEEIESVADLSENDESASLSTLRPQPQRREAEEDDSEAPLSTLHDRAVDDENALNSYDYIEDVERD